MDIEIPRDTIAEEFRILSIFSFLLRYGYWTSGETLKEDGIDVITSSGSR
jgi:hypothetical protein